MRIRLLISGLFTALALQMPAAGFLSTNLYRVEADQIVADEQWVMTSAAALEGTFENDLFIACGGPLTLNGSYEGNIWGASGSDTKLEGPCERNVRVTGKTVQIIGHVGGNVMAMADTVIFAANSVVEGNVRIMAASIILEGDIKGGATITGGRLITLGGTIGKDVRAIAPDILFSSGAQIAGNLEYTANKALMPAKGVVGGTIQRVTPQPPPLFSFERLASRMWWFLAAFLAGVPFIAFFPMTTAMASQLIKKAMWKCVLVGILASVAVPMIVLACASSIIGWPLGMLLLTSWSILIYLSRIIVGLVLGAAILRPGGTSIGRVLLSMALGLAIIYFATILPMISLPVQILVAWMGMGSLILALLQKRRLIIQVPDELKQIEQLKQKNKQEESP